MIKRQLRIRRIEDVYQEFLAARTARDLLSEQLQADPSHGDRFGWKPRADRDYSENLDSTFIIRIYAEFEAALRAYWRTFLHQPTYPKMYQLVNEAIPDQRFSLDIINRADEVREYRSYLVHEDRESEEESEADRDEAESLRVTVKDAKSSLRADLGRLDPAWK